MGFVSFFTTGKSYVSPSFILMVPVDAMGYYLLWGNGANGTSYAWHAAEPANRRAGVAHNACAVDGMLAGSIEIDGLAAVIAYVALGTFVFHFCIRMIFVFVAGVS